MIYIDGDGPLQDFARWMEENTIPHGYDLKGTEEMFHKKIDEIFLSSPNAKYLFYFYKMYCNDKENVRVLTAVGDHWPNIKIKRQAKKNKMLALYRLGFAYDHIIVVDTGSDKIKYALNEENEPNILYDDKWSTVKRWEEAGGFGFFVPECYLRYEDAGRVSVK